MLHRVTATITFSLKIFSIIVNGILTKCFIYMKYDEKYKCELVNLHRNRQSRNV